MKAVKRDEQELRNSGVEWIGKIPKAWSLSKTKYVADFNPKLTIKFDTNLPIGYVPMDAVKFGYMEPLEHDYKSLSTGLTQFQEDDIVMAKVTPCFENGEIAIAKNLAQGVGFGSSELFVYRTTEINQRYFFYYLQQRGFVDKATSTMTGTGGLKRISSYFANNAEVTFPTTEEQQAIVDYLDDRCSKIDAIIAEAKVSIEEYKELKQTLISSKVLCGLQSKVNQTSTSEKWLPKIPKHWRFEKGRHLFYETNVRSSTGTEELLTVSQYTGITPRSQKNVTMIEAESLEDYKICEIGDIAANTMWMWAGAVGVSSYYGVISPSYNTYRQLHNDFHNSYLDYLLRTPELVCEYASRSTGIRASRLRLYPAQFLSIYFPVPPKEEQLEIVAYLEQRLPQMDALISEKQSLIEDLEAYKKSLIYEVVTGKRKVVA